MFDAPFANPRIILDYEGLGYNPCDDLIFPSVVDASAFSPEPLGRYYLYHAPHNAPGGICLAYADAIDGPWEPAGSDRRDISIVIEE